MEGLSKSRPTEKSELDISLRYLKGVGEKLAQRFQVKDVATIRDILYFFPRTYEDRRKIYQISELVPGLNAVAIGRIRRANPVFFSRSKRRAFEVLIEDLNEQAHMGSSILSLTWFNAPYLKSKFEVGQIVMVMGEVQDYRQKIQMVHPDIEILGKTLSDELKTPGIIPIYSETDGLFQKTIRKTAKSALNLYARFIEESLPQSILDHYGYPGLKESLRELHCPNSKMDFETLISGTTPYHKRLVYEEFFELSLGLGLKRRDYTDERGIEFKKPEALWEKFKKNIPFQFTQAQKRVLHEILDDMVSARRMHRLIQGDVGCGKTVVAAAAALIAIEAGYQVAIMAPTEILIEQHFKNFENWFQGMGIPSVILTGSLSTPEKRKVLDSIKTNSPLIVFGTHALFESSVDFKKLGLVIVDEQHRFGVRQRAALVEKGIKPDLLVMTATPIPRTLALTLYGDLDVSVIDELPPGRKPIETRVFTDRQRMSLNKDILMQLQANRQVYIVFPLIAESEELKLKSIEEMFPHIEEYFKEFKVAHLHGRMKADEKSRVLQAFKANEIQILVSTTVVEVGVDVPNATVMVIENAERFGLSQLHQLRGRVGRGAEQSFCYLVASHLGTPEIVQRLRGMERIHDGFKLSELDLEMRGPGEFLGTRQSGLPAFQLARLPRDLNLLQAARKDAFDWIQKDPGLKLLPEMKRRLKVAELIHLN